jgi:hypothetical protein
MLRVVEARPNPLAGGQPSYTSSSWEEIVAMVKPARIAWPSGSFAAVTAKLSARLCALRLEEFDGVARMDPR